MIKTYSDNDEIDVVALIRHLVKFLYANKIKFILFPILFLIIGVFLFFELPSTYEVSMLADSKVLSSEEVANNIESWQKLLRGKDRQTLAARLQVSPNIINKVAKLEATPNINTEKGTFIITATVTDNTILDSLQVGIVYGLTNNEYSKRRDDFEKNQLNQLKIKTEQEIQQLDSIKAEIQTIIRGTNRPSSTFISDPGNINIRQLELYEKLLEINKSIQFIEDIQVIKGFDQIKTPNIPTAVPYMVGGLILGFIVALIIALVQRIRMIL